MRNHTATNRLSWRVRLAIGLAVAAVVATLFLAASSLAHEFEVFGIDDKLLHLLGHLTVYGLLAVGLAVAMGKRFITAGLVTAGLSIAEEYHQRLVPGRTFSFEDMLLNLASVTVFLLVAWAAVEIHASYRPERRDPWTQLAPIRVAQSAQPGQPHPED
jgi:VanZ family protein